MSIVSQSADSAKASIAKQNTEISPRRRQSTDSTETSSVLPCLLAYEHDIKHNTETTSRRRQVTFGSVEVEAIKGDPIESDLTMDITSEQEEIHIEDSIAVSTPQGMKPAGDLTCDGDSQPQETPQIENSIAGTLGCTAPLGVWPPTTIILWGFAEEIDRSDLCEMLDASGFHCQYDFLWLPIKRKTGQHKGIAYVNFLTHEAAICAIMKLSQWCQSSWSPGCQGLHRLLESYRSSGLMSPDTPDECKPIIFLNGYPVELPQEA